MGLRRHVGRPALSRCAGQVTTGWHNAPMSVHFDLVDLRLMVRVAEANSLTKGAEASRK